MEKYDDETMYRNIGSIVDDNNDVGLPRSSCSNHFLASMLFTPVINPVGRYPGAVSRVNAPQGRNLLS